MKQYYCSAFIHRPLPVILVFITLFVLAIPFFKEKQTLPTELIGVVRQNPLELQDFSLTDQHNHAYTQEQLRGKNNLIFFGYLSCPDICPTTLATLNLFINKMATRYPEDLADTRVIFVSVDPQRDNPEKIAAYLAYFNKNFIGLTGKKIDIDHLTKQLGAGYVIENPETDKNYLVSHTSSIFMVDKDLRFVASFSPPHNVDTLLSQYIQIKHR